MTSPTPPSTHGGRRDGAGRKPSPSGARACLLSIRIPCDLRARLESYARHHGLSLASACIAWLDRVPWARDGSPVARSRPRRSLRPKA